MDAMNTNDYAARIQVFRAHIEVMRHTPPFEVINWRVFKPMREASILQMEEYVAQHQDSPNFHVLPTMRPFYHVTTGWELTWVYWEPSPITNNPPNGQSLLSGPGELYAPVDWAEQDIPYDEGYRVFDALSANEEVVLKFHRGIDEPEFHLHHMPSDSYHPLALDFPTYMDLLLQTRGLSPWQHFFVTSPNFRIDDRTREGFLDNLRRLFPEADTSRFPH